MENQLSWYKRASIVSESCIASHSIWLFRAFHSLKSGAWSFRPAVFV